MIGATAIVVMGPSGIGKTTLAHALAKRLGWQFIEGDAHHPPANLARMKRGEPLTDADRAPFLASVGRALAAAPDGAVAACSALKKSYREALERAAGRQVLFVYPRLSPLQLQQRMTERNSHFMPVSLLGSQLATLEVPGPRERCLKLDGEAPVEKLVERVVLAITGEALHPVR